MSASIRVLLTGGYGMVGRNVREHPAASRVHWIIPDRTQLNLKVPERVSDFLAESKADFVVHAAGRVGGIQANIAQPVNFLVDNLEMGKNVILAAREAGIKRLINLGSSCMYPRGSLEPLREDEILSGRLEPTNEAYALAKITVARLCEYIGHEDSSYEYKTLIPCNLYGRFDSFEPERSHLVAAIICKLHEAKLRGIDTVEIWGDGSARREFMYAGDFADAIVHAIQNFDSLPALMNVGVGEDHTVGEYYATAARVIGFNGGFTYAPEKPVGMDRKLVCIERQTAWGWHATTTLEQGVKLTYQYFLQAFPV
jgi:GDP-L-fucose synthase